MRAGPAGKQVALSRVPPTGSKAKSCGGTWTSCLYLRFCLRLCPGAQFSQEGEKSHIQLLAPPVLFLGFVRSSVAFITVSVSSSLHQWIQLVQLSQGQGVLTTCAPRLQWGSSC